MLFLLRLPALLWQSLQKELLFCLRNIRVQGQSTSISVSYRYLLVGTLFWLPPHQAAQCLCDLTTKRRHRDAFEMEHEKRTGLLTGTPEETLLTWVFASAGA